MDGGGICSGELLLLSYCICSLLFHGLMHLH
jgi:hypothetical protein